MDEGLAEDPSVRESLLAAMAGQVKADYLADRVRAGNMTVEEISKKRKAVWKEHTEDLRSKTSISIDEKALARFSDGLDSKK